MSLPTLSEDVTPREIVAFVHRKIAAKSPEHAALVAEFEARRRAVPRDGRQAGGQAAGKLMSEASQVRMRQYGELRSGGLNVKQAAAQTGIHLSTAYRYESKLCPVGENRP